MKKTEQELRQALNTQVPVPGGAQVNEVELQTRIATLEADLAQAADAVDVEKQKRKNLESDHEMIRVEYDRLVHSVASKSTVAKLEHTISELTDKLETIVKKPLYSNNRNKNNKNKKKPFNPKYKKR